MDDLRYYAYSGLKSDIAPCPLSAKTGLPVAQNLRPISAKLNFDRDHSC